MESFRSLWLVINSASGSNDDCTVDELKELCARQGLQISNVTCFPEEHLPTVDALARAECGLVAVFTGDGTINSLVTSLYGWDGAILVLPGGTKNLLFHRLHGQRSTREVLEAVSAGQVNRRRPTIIRCEYGDALAGAMAGPGTAWNEVREAMRDADIATMASEVAHAFGESVDAPMVVCRDPALGREEGYPLLELTPHAEGFEVEAYYAESLDEYLAHGLALLKRDFREGPSDRLGNVPHLKVESVSAQPVGLLVDGEPIDTGDSVSFELAVCEVDLLASEPDD